ncbi:MAG TPA: group III truncated hemoglobin [Sulfurimonas sp.]|nr:group III truncated hemoglobin [Sulfurimonas sp.]
MLELQSSITRENLRVLMTSFYTKAINDDLLGFYFVHELGDDITSEEWIDHVELLADFWLAKILGEDTYYGNFVGAHVKMPLIKKESFARWLDLFSQTADEVYSPEVAAVFKKKAIEFVKEFFTSKKKI